MLARSKTSKKNVIDVDLKTKIISDADKGMKTNWLSRKYGLPASTISSIKKNKENIISAVKSGFNCKRQRLRKPHFEQLEKDLNVWFLRCRDNNFPISRSIIKTKAEQLHAASANASKPFKASNGWISRFVKRQQVCLDLSRLVFSFVWCVCVTYLNVLSVAIDKNLWRKIVGRQKCNIVIQTRVGRSKNRNEFERRSNLQRR